MNGPADTSSGTAEMVSSTRHESARRQAFPRPWILAVRPIVYPGAAAVPLATSLLLYGKGHLDLTSIQTLAAATLRARCQRSRETFSAGEEEQQRIRREAIFEVDGLSPTRAPQTLSDSSMTRTSMDPPAAKQALVPKQANEGEGIPYDYEWSSGLEGPLGCEARMFLDGDVGLAQSQPWLFGYGEVFVHEGRRSKAWTSVAALRMAGEARHG
jgi:hypothetical protein